MRWIRGKASMSTCFYWSLKEVGDGLKPQEKLSLEEKISIYFEKFPESISLSEIAEKVGTSYEYVRRIYKKLFLEGEIAREKNASAGGRPLWLFGPKTFPTSGK